MPHIGGALAPGAVWKVQMHVPPAGDGAHLAVAWDINPRTFWRQLLFAKVRRRQLAAEVPASLDAIATRVA